MSDTELVARFVEQDDRKALGALYDRHIDNLYRFVYLRVGRKELAEDIVSNTFETFIKIAVNYDNTSKLSTFLCGIAFNLIRRSWANHKVEAIADVEIEDLDIVEKDAEQDNSFQNEKNTGFVGKILNELPENYSSVLKLRFIEGKNIKETAKLLQLSTGNIKVLQNRALKKAKEISGLIISSNQS